MDVFIRRYIHDELLYRYIIVEDGREALSIETVIKSGAWGRGRPFLNPIKTEGRTADQRHSHAAGI
jgi:hypothetical protein